MVLVLLLVSVSHAWASEEIKKDNIGPWEIEAALTNNKFDHCSISRKVDEMIASFRRTNDGLTLTLESPNWKLDRGKKYSVRMRAGAATWNTNLAAEASAQSGFTPTLGTSA